MRCYHVKGGEDLKLVRPQKISDQVLAVLEERIAEGVYEEGSKIPPERALAEEFGVSRPSIRVALNVLIAKQVLEARHGDGYYVSVKPQQDFLQSWQELLGKHSNWETDVFDFSCHIEGCMAALAAERRTDADLKRMSFWLQKFEAACKSGNLAHQTEADVSFHQAIADAAHNLLFSHLSGSLLKMLYQQTRSSIIYHNQAEDPRPKLIAQHRAVFDAIQNQCPADAAEAAKVHLNYVANSILQDREYQSRSELADSLAQKDLKRVQDW